VLRLTGDIRRNIAYTTNARIVRHEVEGDADNTQRVRLIVQSDGRDALLLNITPRLGFNRYIRPPEETIEAAARRWHDWFAAAPAVSEPYRAQYYFAWWIARRTDLHALLHHARSDDAVQDSLRGRLAVGRDMRWPIATRRWLWPKISLRIVLDHQRSDGLIPTRCTTKDGNTPDLPVEADVTPPLVAWSA
jgi:hypothetical protein